MVPLFGQRSETNVKMAKVYFKKKRKNQCYSLRPLVVLLWILEGAQIESKQESQCCIAIIKGGTFKV